MGRAIRCYYGTESPLHAGHAGLARRAYSLAGEKNAVTLVQYRRTADPKRKKTLESPTRGGTSDGEASPLEDALLRALIPPSPLERLAKLAVEEAANDAVLAFFE